MLVVFPLVVIVLVARVFLFMLSVIGEIVGPWARRTVQREKTVGGAAADSSSGLTTAVTVTRGHLGASFPC